MKKYYKLIREHRLESRPFSSYELYLSSNSKINLELALFDYSGSKCKTEYILEKITKKEFDRVLYEFKEKTS